MRARGPSLPRFKAKAELMFDDRTGWSNLLVELAPVLFTFNLTCCMALVDFLPPRYSMYCLWRLASYYDVIPRAASLTFFLIPCSASDLVEAVLGAFTWWPLKLSAEFVPPVPALTGTAAVLVG